MIRDMMMILFVMYLIIAIFYLFYSWLEDRQRNKELERIMQRLRENISKLNDEEEENDD